MKTIIRTSLCAAVAACTSAIMVAQTPAPQATPSPQTNPSSSERQVTLTGCLKEAPSTSAASASGSAAAAGTTTAGTTGSTTAGTAGSTTAGTTGTAGAPPAAGTATAPDASPQYVLANATMSTGEAASATGTAGTTGTTGTTAAAGAAGATSTTGSAAAASAGQTYRLIANASALTPHVGKKLELTGTLDEGSSASPASASGPALRVTSGKVVANSCQ